MKSTRVFILGAGASRSAGLPLGSGVQDCLRDLLKTSFALDECANLRRVIEKTLGEMENNGTATIDQLVAVQADNELAEEAKLAMSAAMLAREQTIQPRNLSSYCRCLTEILGGEVDRDWKEVLDASDVRILTFNYDRVFEQAFQQWLKAYDVDRNDIRPIYRDLNSGLGNPKKCAIDRERFAFVKLHGSAGTYARDRDFGFQHPIPYPQFPLDVPITDSLFFSADGTRLDRSQIVFPSEKDGIELFEPAPVPVESFEGYLRAVWTAARDFIEAAREIIVIGYSIQPIDRRHFERLLKCAPEGTPTVVQDTDPTPADTLKQLCPHLRIRHLARRF
jgi:hypothetical protein